MPMIIETVGKMLDHKDLRSTQKYTKITKRKITNNMKALESKIFEEEGSLKKFNNYQLDITICDIKFHFLYLHPPNPEREYITTSTNKAGWLPKVVKH
jgi:hypothetical protein